jgi:hypothetical protein
MAGNRLAMQIIPLPESNENVPIETEWKSADWAGNAAAIPATAWKDRQ